MDLKGTMVKAVADDLPAVMKLIGLDDEDTGWRTTENGKHYHINEKGDIDKGPSALVGKNVHEASGEKSVKVSEPKRIRPKDKDEIVKMVAGPDSYMLKPEYKETVTKWRDAFNRNSELSKEWLEVQEKLDKEVIVDPDLGRSLSKVMGYYTEKGKEIAEQEKALFEKVKQSEAEYTKYGDELDKIKLDNHRKQWLNWESKPMQPAREAVYPGFSLESDVPYIAEKIETGKAKIVEMSPKEYLERCAYQIFGEGTLESQIGSVDLKNVNKYADAMELGDQFPIPYLNFVSENQEGRHRALAAMMNGYEKIPVAVVGGDVSMRESETSYDPNDGFVEDPNFDIFEWLSNGEEEEPGDHSREYEKQEKEAKERGDYGQNGLLESEYPEELRLNDKEREQIFDVLHGYRDSGYRMKTGADLMSALNGFPEDVFIQKEKQYEKDLEKAEKMIQQRKAEGYKFGNTAAGQAGYERKRQWWEYYNEHGEAPPELVGENGIRHWQTMRKNAMHGLNEIALAKKIAKREAFAKGDSHYLPWRQNPNAENQWYKPWAKDSAETLDEEVWRTNEEGRHFKLESTTGEIKAGFGGRANGKKVGESWSPKPESSSAPKEDLAGSLREQIKGLSRFGAAGEKRRALEKKLEELESAKKEPKEEAPKSSPFHGFEAHAGEYRATPTMKSYDELMPIYQDSFRAMLDEAKTGFAQHPEQAAAIDEFESSIPKYEDALETAFNENDFCSRTDDTAIVSILKDGMLKSQIETGSSKGLNDKEMRMSVSANLFNGGESFEIGDDQYETYGYLDNAPRARMYGNCRIVMNKDRVGGRTTFTVGDSLGQWCKGNSQVPTLVSDPKVLSWMTSPFTGAMTPEWVTDQANKAFDEIKKSGTYENGAYIELQFHGRVTTGDIDYIEVPKSSPKREEIKNLAAQQGVRIRWM